MTQTLYSISEVGRAFGLPVSTLRYYDDIGLVTAPIRRSRVRYYDRAALDHLAYVQIWGLEAGLSLHTIAAIVSSANRAERNTLIEHSITEIALRIDQLRQAHDTLQHLLRCPEDHPADCHVNRDQVQQRVDQALDNLLADDCSRIAVASP